MHTVDFVVDDSQRPSIRQWILWLLEPGDPAGLVVSADEVEVAIPIHVEAFAVDKVFAGSLRQNHLSVIRSDEQPRLVLADGDHVDFAVLGEVAAHCRIRMGSFVDEMLLPKLFGPHDGGR